MENIEKNNLEVSESVRTSLDTMVYWSKFLAIVGYIGIGLILLVVVAIISTSTDIKSFGTYEPGIIAVIYLVMAVIYYFPVNYLYKFATNTRHALTSDSQTSLNFGLSNLASSFKCMGVLTLVILSLYALIFLFAIVGGMGSMLF